jgi:serine protease Do
MCSADRNVPVFAYQLAAKFRHDGQPDRDHVAGSAASRSPLMVCCLLATLLLPLSPGAEAADEPAAPEALPALPKAPPVTRWDLPGALRKDVPSSLEDLQSIETHVEQLAARVSRAVVAVGVDGATGSGVVVSENGLVLTAAHVAGEPNREVRFTFPDGKTARGKTLGTNHEMDAGLMKISDEGQWPHVDIGELTEARLGDWVLGLGHPGGYDPQRPVVVRLGRIIRLGSGMLETDCTLIGGDSGGPLFDMHGQVVGIHSRISDSIAANFHVPITAYRESWSCLAKGDNWGGRRPGPRSFVGARGADHPEGCQLERIEPDSPASRADLKVGDIVTRVNGKKIEDYQAFRQWVAEAKPGEKLTLDIKRDDEKLSVTVTVEARRWRGRGRPGP